MELQLQIGEVSKQVGSIEKERQLDRLYKRLKDQEGIWTKMVKGLEKIKGTETKVQVDNLNSENTFLGSTQILSKV